MDRRDDTMNLEAIRAMLNDVSESDEFDLDSIIAEVEGHGTAQPKAKPQTARPAQPVQQPQPKPQAMPEPERVNIPEPEMQPARPAAAPQTAPKTRAAHRPAPDELPDMPEDIEDEIDEDPRAARMAAREAKAQARQQKAEAKAAAKAARHAAKRLPEEEDESEAYEEPEAAPSPRRAERGERKSRKEARAARIAAEQAEEAEDIRLRDPAQAARAFKRRAKGLTARATMVLILAIAAAYLSIAPSYEMLPLPEVVNAAENPGIGIGVLIALQVVALLLGLDVFSKGFYGLFHGAPDRATLVSFTVVATLLHAVSIIAFDNTAGVEIPYLAVSILLLYAAMREERGRYAARARAYQAICSAEKPMAIYSHYDREDDACRAVKGPLHDKDSFLLEMERPDTVDRFSMIYVPVALAAAVIFSLVASVVRGEPMRFFWAFSAIMSVSAPLGLLCAFGASYKNVSRRLLGSGAAIAGARQANLLRGTEEVVLTENDLFPAGTISLVELQNAGRLSDDRVLACAAALADAVGLELGRVLSAAAQERYGVTFAARNVQMVEGGIAGEIGGSRMILGTPALMVQMGLRIRSGQMAEDKIGLYLAMDDALAGVLILRYQPTKSTHQAMRLMRRMHMNVALAVRDFNISPAMVESQFDLRHGFVDQPTQERVKDILNPAYTKEDLPAAILTREGSGALVQVLRCADKLAGAVRSSLTLGAFAGIGGMLIVFYLVFQNAVEALPIIHLLLYLLIWYVPTFIITQQTH